MSLKRITWCVWLPSSATTTTLTITVHFIHSGISEFYPLQGRTSIWLSGGIQSCLHRSGEDFLKLLLLLPSFRVDTDRHRYCLGSNSMQILDALSLLACCHTIQVEPTCSAQCPQVKDNCCTHTGFMEYFFTCSSFLTLLSSVDNPSTQLFSFFLISGLRSLPLHQSFRVQVCLQRYKTRTKKKSFKAIIESTWSDFVL